jgi:hypothetical protein
MQDLMHYSKDHPELSVRDALDTLVQSYSSQNQSQMNVNQMNNVANFGQTQANGIQQPGAQFQPGFSQGARTPSGQGGMPQRMQNPDGSFITMSPAMQHSLLPGVQANGSPHLTSGGTPISLSSGMVGNAHTPSPHQSNMAPPMAPQHSQQGSATGASANTSPNVSGKRRRSTAQGVKNEGDDPGGVNGAGSKVKQSPRMGSGPKRLKNG